MDSKQIIDYYNNELDKLKADGTILEQLLSSFDVPKWGFKSLLTNI